MSIWYNINEKFKIEGGICSMRKLTALLLAVLMMAGLLGL